MIDQERETWLAVRKEAAKSIDPATAEFHWEWGNVVDPYGIYGCEAENVGRNYFARAPGSDVWVSFDDLPQSVLDDLRKNRAKIIPPAPPPLHLPEADELVCEIMTHDDGEPGYAAAVARGIVAKLPPAPSHEAP